MASAAGATVAPERLLEEEAPGPGRSRRGGWRRPAVCAHSGRGNQHAERLATRRRLGAQSLAIESCGLRLAVVEALEQAGRRRRATRSAPGSPPAGATTIRSTWNCSAGGRAQLGVEPGRVAGAARAGRPASGCRPALGRDAASGPARLSISQTSHSPRRQTGDVDRHGRRRSGRAWPDRWAWVNWADRRLPVAERQVDASGLRRWRRAASPTPRSRLHVLGASPTPNAADLCVASTRLLVAVGGPTKTLTARETPARATASAPNRTARFALGHESWHMRSSSGQFVAARATRASRGARNLGSRKGRSM